MACSGPWRRAIRSIPTLRRLCLLCRMAHACCSAMACATTWPTAYAHDHGWRVAHHLSAELRTLERRVAALIEHGWKQLVVVTDHGWLLLPGGLPKADLPEHLTEVRKGRCARLKEGSKTDQQVVP